jgi:hypothetical protein
MKKASFFEITQVIEAKVLQNSPILGISMPQGIRLPVSYCPK